MKPNNNHFNCQSFKALAALNVVPIGSDVSISGWVAECVRLLQSKGLHVRVNALGTEVEGELADILCAVGECHQMLHTLGLSRIITHLTLSTRTDRTQSLEEKRDAVLQKLSPPKMTPAEPAKDS